MPFQYQKRDPESFQKRENFQDSISSRDNMLNDGSVVFFRPHDGTNNIRILPPTWENPDHYGYDLHVHYGVGPDKSSYLSLLKHLGKPDPIDEAFAHASRINNKKMQRKCRATRRVAIWLIDRAEPGRGPMLWLSPAEKFDRAVIRLMKNQRAIDDADNGFDVSFIKEGVGLGATYSDIEIAKRPSPLSVNPDEKERWLSYVKEKPIPSLLKFYPYERILEVFNSVVSNTEQQTEPQPQPPAATPTEPQPRNEAYAHVSY